jgi:hypothetical protein
VVARLGATHQAIRQSESQLLRHQFTLVQELPPSTSNYSRRMVNNVFVRLKQFECLEQGIMIWESLQDVFRLLREMQ